MPIRVIGQGPGEVGYTYQTEGADLIGGIGNLFTIPERMKQLQQENEMKAMQLQEQKTRNLMLNQQVNAFESDRDFNRKRMMQEDMFRNERLTLDKNADIRAAEQAKLNAEAAARQAKADELNLFSKQASDIANGIAPAPMLPGPVEAIDPRFAAAVATAKRKQAESEAKTKRADAYQDLQQKYSENALKKIELAAQPKLKDLHTVRNDVIQELTAIELADMQAKGLIEPFSDQKANMSLALGRVLSTKQNEINRLVAERLKQKPLEVTGPAEVPQPNEVDIVKQIQEAMSELKNIPAGE